MSSTQTRLAATLVVSIIIAGAAITAIVLMQQDGNTNTNTNTDLITVPEDDLFVTVSGMNGSSINVSLTEMISMDVIFGNSSYQNTYGNIRGEGNYSGVRISDLMDLVGGMTDNYLLRVEAFDGYSQTFDYSKVYPNSTIYEYQGDMVLAYAFNGLVVPYYEDGFRLAFIPEDGYYSNADANASTDPDPAAAGPQWVSNVVHLSLLLNLYNSTLEVSEEFLRGLPSVTGPGGYIKKDGVTIIGPYNYTGVPFTVLIHWFSIVPDYYIIKSISSDGYTIEYTKDVVNGIVNGYTPTGDPIEVINSTMVLAYEEDGAPISGADGGPLKIVFINEDGNLTDGFRWAKDVVSISILEVVAPSPTLQTMQQTLSLELILIPTKYH